MRVRIARSTKMPTLYSYYVSGFDENVLEYFKRSKPFTIYHRGAKEYEITKEVYKKVASSYDIITDERVDSPVFTRISKEKYGYQKDAVAFARKVDNVLINFPQGTGKSRTTMMIIDDRQFRKTLVVCGQANLQEEWLKDARKHEYAEKLNFRIVGESTEAPTVKKAEWIKANANVRGVDLINIEGLRNVKIVNAINAVGYDCIVIDEVQSAKGWKAAQTVGMHNIAEKPGQVRLALSGTPILNSPLEFFSVLKFLRQLNATARTTYERYYGEWSFDFWGHYVCNGFRNLDELQELLKPVIAYVDKKELGLPEKRRYMIKLEQPKSEELQYLEKVYRMSTARLKREGFSSKPQIRAKIQLIASSADIKIDYIDKCFKDTKVLVFSQYVEALKLVQSQLVERGKKVLLYTGELGMAQRLAILEQWYYGDYDVLLLSLMGARYGLNLVEAQDVVFLEPPVSLAVLEQAEDRAHRIGQDKAVRSHMLCWHESDIDRLNNITNKQEAIDEVYSFLSDNNELRT